MQGDSVTVLSGIKPSEFDLKKLEKTWLRVGLHVSSPAHYVYGSIAIGVLWYGSITGMYELCHQNNYKGKTERYLKNKKTSKSD